MMKYSILSFSVFFLLAASSSIVVNASEIVLLCEPGEGFNGNNGNNKCETEKAIVQNLLEVCTSGDQALIDAFEAEHEISSRRFLQQSQQEQHERKLAWEDADEQQQLDDLYEMMENMNRQRKLGSCSEGCSKARGFTQQSLCCLEYQQTDCGYCVNYDLPGERRRTRKLGNDAPNNNKQKEASHHRRVRGAGSTRRRLPRTLDNTTSSSRQRQLNGNDKFCPLATTEELFSDLTLDLSEKEVICNALFKALAAKETAMDPKPNDICFGDPNGTPSAACVNWGRT